MVEVTLPLLLLCIFLSSLNMLSWIAIGQEEVCNRNESHFPKQGSGICTQFRCFGKSLGGNQLLGGLSSLYFWLYAFSTQPVSRQRSSGEVSI